MVVVGAGPAGAVTALLLARAGRRVLILDRASFPRPKPCGDCLSAGATELLARLGVLDAVLAAGPATLGGWDVVTPGGRVVHGRLRHHPALAMERARFDAVLLDAALRAGADFARCRVEDVLRDGRGSVEGVRARLSDGRTVRVRAELVVGADGLRSVVARRLGLIRRRPRVHKLSLTAHLPCPSERAVGTMHLLPGGCVGVAPVGEGRTNVTLVVDGGHAHELREAGAPAFFREWLGRAPRIDPALLATTPRRFLASGPFDIPTRAVTAPGVALVGDAAGYFDPFTGQGIYRALAGAMALAACIEPALDGVGLGSALRRYAAVHARLATPSRRLQRGIEIVVSRPDLSERVMARLDRAPAVMDRLLQVTGDLRPPRSLLSPALLWTFAFPPAAETT